MTPASPSPGSAGTVRDALWAAALAAFCFSVYAAASSPTLLACGDSPELITAAWTLGVPHAPGYPLYCLLGRLVASLAPGSPAHRLDLCMGLLASAACAFIFLLLARLTGSKLKAAVGALILAFSYHFQLFAHVPEIPALNAFFGALLCLLVYRHAQAPREKWTELGAFVFGLAFCHHQTIVFLLPGLLYAALGARSRAGLAFSWDWAGRVYALFFLGLTPYFYVLIRGRAMPFLNTGTVTDAGRLLDHILRRETGTLRLSSQYSEFQWDHSVGLAAFFCSSLVRSFSWAGVLAGFYGFQVLYRRSRETFGFIAAGVLLAGPGFLILTRMPAESVSLIALLERFLVLPFVLFAVPVGVGLAAICDAAAVPLAADFPRGARAAALAAALLLPAGLFAENLKALDLRRFDLCEMYGRDLLRSLPQNTLAMMDGDTSLFTLWYLQRAEGLRPDVQVLNSSITPRSLETLRDNYPRLSLPTSAREAGRELIADNFNRYPVYEAGMPGTKLKEFGLWHNPYFPQPRGLALQVVTRFDPADDDEALWNSLEFRRALAPGPDAPAFERDIFYLYTLARYNKAAYLYLAGAQDAAYRALQATLALDPDFAPAKTLLLQINPPAQPAHG